MVSDEEVAQDPEMYDCQNCPVADALDDLEADAANAAAWRLFHRITCRFAADLHTGSIALERLTTGMDPDEFADLFERLRMLYDVLCPPPERKAQD